MTQSNDLFAWSTLGLGELPHQLLVQNHSLSQLKIVRNLPNRRLVLQGVWLGAEVYAKIFLGKDAKKYALRDKNGCYLLKQAHIASPNLRYAGTLASDIEVLIFEAVSVSVNAEVAYAHTLDDVARRNIMERLVQTVAQHHRAGLIQTDLYFKNFLVSTESIYTLDGDGIRTLKPLFKSKKKISNLATLFSKMDVLDDIWIDDLYQLYCQELGISFSMTEAFKVWELTQNIRAKVNGAYADKKVFRNCTDVKITQHFDYFTAVTRDFLVDENTLRVLDNFLENTALNFKNGNTCTIGKAEIARQKVVIKRYNIKGLSHRFGRALRKSRAAISWANAHRLIMVNIATPKPLALVEERAGVFRKRAYFVSEYVDAPDVVQFFAQTHDAETRQRVAIEIATLFYRLSLLKISHGDCKASNIKIKDGKPLLLDLDAMQASPWFFNQKHVRDLKRFMRNWENNAEMIVLFKDAFSNVYDEAFDPWVRSLLESADIS